MKIYTKTGDDGTTSLFGGRRVQKDNIRISAYGTVDELNSVIGISLSYISNSEIQDVLKLLQNQLFELGSDLASPIANDNKKSIIPRIKENHLKQIENKIDYFEEKLPALTNFILPGGSKGAAYLHFARTVCRRAERSVVSLDSIEKINENCIIYLNRLSDLFFVLARFENISTGQSDIEWNNSK